MNGWSRLICIVASVGLSGCVSFSPSGVHQPRRVRQTFSFVVQSEPSGAEVYKKVEGKDVRLGTTPLALPLEFELRRDGQAADVFRPRTWHPVTSKSHMAATREGRYTIRVDFPEVELRKPGFAPETFTYTWKFPSNLKERVAQFESVPVPTRHEWTVYFRDPTAPEYLFDITIDCAMPGARVHAINQQGEAGELIGPTPVHAKVGFGRTRAAAGQFLDWKRWNGPNAGLFTHTREGDVLLQCVLVHDGYEPVKLQNRRIARIEGEPGAKAMAARYQMLKPVKPEAEFKLSVDSLPSGADVYEVRDDGALGRKVGQTPFTMDIGMAQESVEETPGKYLHKDWVLWAPAGLIHREDGRGGVTQVYLSCALYKEGLAVENVLLPVFQLEPGKAFPDETTLTIPIMSAEQAAARESRMLRERMMPIAQPTPHGVAPAAPASQPPPDAFVWKAPAVEEESANRAPPVELPPKAPRPWWKRILP